MNTFTRKNTLDHFVCIHCNSQRGKYEKGAVWRWRQTKKLQFCRSCSPSVLCPVALCLQGMQSSSCDPVSTRGANQAVVWQEGAVSGVTLTLSVWALAGLVCQRWELCVVCLLLKAESSGVYVVHVLLAVTNLMSVFFLIQNILWLWCFMFFSSQ